LFIYHFSSWVNNINNKLKLNCKIVYIYK
jgi:hypothetical protein